MLSEGGGQGVQTLVVLQDMSQARRRWPREADGIPSLFGAKVVMAGVADVQTLEQLSLICGGWDRPVQTITEQHSPVFSGKSSTTSEAWTTRRERRLPPDQIAQLHRGQALVIVRSSWRILPAIPYQRHPPSPASPPSATRQAVNEHHPLPGPPSHPAPAAGLSPSRHRRRGEGSEATLTAPRPVPPSPRSGERDHDASLIDVVRHASQARGEQQRQNGAAPTPLDVFSPPRPRSTEALLTADDDADILGVPRTFVYALARRGELPTVRIGDRYVRFRSETLQRWIEQHETTDRRGTQ